MKNKLHFHCTGCGFCSDILDGSLSSTGFSPSDLDLAAERLLKVRCPCIPDTSFIHGDEVAVHPLLGPSVGHYVGFSQNNKQRLSSSSGGVLTEILVYLLDKGLVSHVALPMPVNASETQHAYRLVNDENDLRNAAQSIYRKVPVGNILNEIRKIDGKICFVGLPDQNQAIHKISSYDPEISKKIFLKIGPMTGIMMDGDVIEFLPRLFHNSSGIKRLRWRAGEWPGHLLVEFCDGQIIRLHKFYYNFLLPFFCSIESLVSQDFSNEFADISVGDAWSPKYEVQGKGFSLVSSKSTLGEEILTQVNSQQRIRLDPIPEDQAVDMHLHMLDFKKRGSFYRKRILRFFGINSQNTLGAKPDFQISRLVIEIVIVTVIMICRTKFSRFLLTKVNHEFAGKIFDALRIKWKLLTKASKRKGILEHGKK